MNENGYLKRKEYHDCMYFETVHNIMDNIPDKESDFSFKGFSPDGSIILSRLNNGKLDLVKYNYDPLLFFMFASLDSKLNIRNIDFKIEDDFFIVEHDNEVIFQSISGERSVLKDTMFVVPLTSTLFAVNYAFFHSNSIYTITLSRKDLSLSKPRILIKDISYHKYDYDQKKLFAISDKKLYAYSTLDISNVQVFPIPDNLSQHILYDIFTLDNTIFLVFIGNRQLKIFNTNCEENWSFPLNSHPKRIFSYIVSTLLFLFLPNEKIIILDTFRNGKVIESTDKSLIKCDFDSAYLTPLNETCLYFDKKQMSFVCCKLDFMKLECFLNSNSEAHWEFLGHLLGFNNFAFNAAVFMKKALQKKMPGFLITFMSSYYVSRLYHILSFAADPVLLTFVASDYQQIPSNNELFSEADIVETLKPLLLSEDEAKEEYMTERMSEINEIYSCEGFWSPSTIYLVFRYAIDFHLPRQKIHHILQSTHIPFILYAEPNNYIKRLIKERQSHLLAMKFLETCITISDHLISLIPTSKLEAILGLTSFYTAARQNHFPISNQAISRLEHLSKECLPKNIVYNMIRYCIIQNPENDEIDLLIRMKDSKLPPTIKAFPSPMITLAKKTYFGKDDGFEPASRLEMGFVATGVPICQDLFENYSIDILTQMYCK